MVTIITGGSRGIGAAIARRLATDGHTICLTYRENSTAAELVAADVDGVAVRADTTVDADIDRVFECAKEMGPITGLVNNAGITSKLGRLTDAEPDLIRRVIEVNVVGYLLCARRAIAEMSDGGSIVNISSAAATLGSPGEYVHYAASKAAVDAMTVGLAKEVAADGIRVNTVSPGIIRTDIHASAGDPERPDRLAGRIPAGRAGLPEEVAAAVGWLMSPEASYTSGATLRVAGGM
jgi:NAD(P)-dependent dehydrogenase (short-subunit alcohol dehydrogenase family)